MKNLLEDVSKIQVEHLLRSVLTERKMIQWWHVPRTRLGGITPSEAWITGKRREVLELAWFTRKVHV